MVVDPSEFKWSVSYRVTNPKKGFRREALFVMIVPIKIFAKCANYAKPVNK